MRERDGDFSLAESWAVALQHSPYALVKLVDVRYLAIREVREAGEGVVELGLRHSSDPPRGQLG